MIQPLLRLCPPFQTILLYLLPNTRLVEKFLVVNQTSLSGFLYSKFMLHPTLLYLLSSEVQSTPNLPLLQKTLSEAQKMTYANHSDMYMQNHLETFSFGAAPSSSSTSVQLFDPLSRPPDDPDTGNFVHIPDTTPRPSVVGNHNPRSRQSQQSLGMNEKNRPPVFRQ